MYTIRPKGESLITWLLKYADAEQHNAPSSHRNGNSVCICLFKSPHGPVARVCYNGLELHNARQQCRAHPSSPCKWFFVPTRFVQPFMHGQVIA